MFRAEPIGMPIDSNIGMPIIARVTYDDLIAHYQTQIAAGEALKVFDGLGVSQPSVAEWKKKGIPAPRQAQYEILTVGKLKADRVVPLQLSLGQPA
jgi:hypothetical protein